jgi:hypothetical protein
MTLWGFAVQDYAVILQALSIMATAFFAIKGLNTWRKQLIGKRRIEVAEAALVAAYNAREAMSMIRHPAVWAGEGTTRQRESGESATLAQSRDREFITLERMKGSHSEFVELEKARVLCEVHFGPEAAAPFTAILQGRHNVFIAASTLLGYTEREPQGAGEHVRELRSEILEGFGRASEADKIAKKVADAVEAIDALCRRQLKA